MFYVIITFLTFKTLKVVELQSCLVFDIVKFFFLSRLHVTIFNPSMGNSFFQKISLFFECRGEAATSKIFSTTIVTRPRNINQHFSKNKIR